MAQILGEKTKGSARSTGQFNLVEGLREVSEHFERFGGHYFAAGFTLKTKHLDRLRTDINRYYKSLNLPAVSGSLKQPDIRLENLSQLTDELYDGLQKLEPYGNGNPKPMFETEVTLRAVNSVGRDGSHLKLEVEDKAGNRFKGIGFGLGAQSKVMIVGSECKAVFQLNKNEYKGRTNLELTVVELRYE